MAPVKGGSVSVCTCCTCKCLYVRMQSLQAYGEDLRASLRAKNWIEQPSASQGCCLLIDESLQLMQCLLQMLQLLDMLGKPLLVVGVWCSGSWPAGWHMLQNDRNSFTLRAHSAQHIVTSMSLQHKMNSPGSHICPVCAQ